MKKLFLLATIASLGAASAFAQFDMGSGGQGTHFDGSMDRLFGDNKAFTAKLEVQTSPQKGGDPVTMSGKYSYDSGKSRFEVNLTEVKGSTISPAMAEQLKTMGMDATVFISRPDLKLSYMIYPGLTSYAELVSKDTTASISTEDYKLENSELGKETVGGHECVKNKATVTDKDGNKHEFTVWNASDLKKFPVKIITEEKGHTSTLLYNNVTLTKPAASVFNVPSGLTKYDSVQTMMQTEMMKKMAGAMGAPAQQH